MKKPILTGLVCLLTLGLSAQGDTETALLLDLKKARADYEITMQKYRNDTRLFEEKAISANDYDRSKNELLSTEVDYQKLILKLISQQSYITVEKAVKYQDSRGSRKVKVTLKSALEGNEEYLSQFRDHFDVFTPEMRSGKIYNVYVSLIDNETKTIIGSPYEYRVASIGLGKTADADFELLKDAESLTVSLNYNNLKDEKNVYLRKDGSVNLIDISSIQFSQETDLGNRASYDISLERFSTSDDVYRLNISGLPRQVSYEFMDGGSKINQIKFAQGIKVKKLSLQVYLPDRDDEQIVIDQPIKFQVDAVSASNGEKAGSEELELIPRGKGKVELRLSSLYYEINTDEKLQMDVAVRNGGRRRLDNVRIFVEKPLGWEADIDPGIIRSLEPEKEEVIKISVTPPEKGGVGAQEIKIKTEAMADNVKVNSEDKTIRVQVSAANSVGGTILLILLLVAVAGGIVWFGMKLSKR